MWFIGCGWFFQIYRWNPLLHPKLNTINRIRQILKAKLFRIACNPQQHQPWNLILDHKPIKLKPNILARRTELFRLGVAGICHSQPCRERDATQVAGALASEPKIQPVKISFKMKFHPQLYNPNNTGIILIHRWFDPLCPEWSGNGRDFPASPRREPRDDGSICQPSPPQHTKKNEV